MTQRTFGKIIAGGKPGKHNYRYIIKPGQPLYRKESADYKRWLWSKMQDDENADDKVINALYEVINGAWVGCDVYVDGPNASAVVAAAGYLLNQYTSTQMPLVERKRQTQNRSD